MLEKLFTSQGGKIEVLEIDQVGPSIGGELRTKAFWILGLVCIFLLVYVGIRFDFAFGVGVLAATIHDALILIACASLLGVEINTEFIAALLTVLGYSINDTVVIFDRVRDLLAHSSISDLYQLANDAVEQTLSRTLNTSLSALLVVGALLLLGGSALKAFSLVLLVGVLVGTYSSYFVATPVWLWMSRRRQVVDNSVTE